MNLSVKKIIGSCDTLEKGIHSLADMHKLTADKKFGIRQLFSEYVVLEIRLLKLVCLETEDTLGHDELALDIFLDGEFEKNLKFRLKEGKSATIAHNGLLTAKHKIALHLYDRDDLEADDLLGNITVICTKEVSGWATKRIQFNKDDAKYDLHYEVRSIYGCIPTALDLVQAFAKRKSTPVWSKIKRKDVAEQLEVRINKPWKINQGPSSFCGPASVLFELARHMPKRYVAMVIALYEKGSWDSADGLLKAPKKLLDKRIPVKIYDNGKERSTPPADWIALTSMRDSANIVFELDEPDDAESSIQAGALPGEVAAWCPQLFGWRNPDIYRTTQFASAGTKLGIAGLGLFNITEFFFKVITGNAIDGLKEAKKVMDKDGAVMLQVNSNLTNFAVDDINGVSDNPTDFQISDNWGNFSNHFLSLYEYDNTMRLENNGKVKISLYTWGGTKKIEVSQELYEQEMFSYVFTKPGAPI